MSIEEQHVLDIPAAGLLERVQRMRAEGWRLVQICCTRLVADQEVTYSFDPDHAAAATGLVSLRVRIPIHDPVLPSISSFYWSAFLYENEMHDLFGVTVNGMAIDFKGRLFTTMVPTPFVAREPEHGD